MLIRKQSSSKPDKQVSANWKPDVGDDVRTQTTAWKKNTINRNRKEVEDWLIGEWGVQNGTIQLHFKIRSLKLF